MIRIAVIGLGWWGKQIVTCLAKSDRFKVVAGFDAEGGLDISTGREVEDQRFHALRPATQIEQERTLLLTAWRPKNTIASVIARSASLRSKASSIGPAFRTTSRPCLPKALPLP